LSGAFAEFERDCIRERVRAGMRNARAKGRHIGRPRAVVDVARIGQLSALGTPWAKIGRTVGLSARTVKRIALKGGGSADRF
jgi:DNA invertase Pin-like site-specific DNA recombinase